MKWNIGPNCLCEIVVRLWQYHFMSWSLLRHVLYLVSCLAWFCDTDVMRCTRKHNELYFMFSTYMFKYKVLHLSSSNGWLLRRSHVCMYLEKISSMEIPPSPHLWACPFYVFWQFYKKPCVFHPVSLSIPIHSHFCSIITSSKQFSFIVTCSISLIWSM